jgi:hypothetical protein
MVELPERRSAVDGNVPEVQLTDILEEMRSRESFLGLIKKVKKSI